GPRSVGTICQGSDGMLYGTTYAGGASFTGTFYPDTPGDGTVYRLGCARSWLFDPPTAFDLCCETNTYIVELGTTATNVSPCQTIYRRVWRATDCCNNSIMHTQSVTVVDTTPPQLTCPPDLLVINGSVWNFGVATAVDLCCGTNVQL